MSTLNEGKSFGKLYKWLNGNVEKSHLKVLLGYCVAIVLLEVMATMNIKIAGIIASRLWMLGWVFCIGMILGMFVKSVIEDIRARRIITLIGLATFIFVVTFTLGDLSKLAINGESAQQLAEGLNSFAMPDWNIAGRAFIDYPARQYLLVSAPSLFFGRTMFSMILGFSYPFYLGIMLMYLGIRKVTNNSGFALTVVSAIWLFPIVTSYYIYFEQTMIPVSFTMHAIGWLLLLVKKPTISMAFGLAWTCAFFSNMYTPGMASLALLLALIGGIGIATKFGLKKRGFDVLRIQGIGDKVSVWLCGILVLFPVVIAGIGILFDGQNPNIADARNEGLTEYLSDFIISLKAYFLNDGAKFTGMISLVIIIYLLVALTLRLGILNAVIALWVLGVIAISCFLTGYATEHGKVTLFRAIITVPVLVSAIGLSLFGYLKKKNINIDMKMCAVVMAFNLFMGAYYLSAPTVMLTPAYFYEYEHTAFPKFVMEDMRGVIKENGIRYDDPMVIATEEELSDLLKDYNEYFYPNAEYVMFAKGDGIPADIPRDGLAVVYYDAASPNVNSIFSEAGGVKEFYVKSGRPVTDKAVEEERIAIRKVLPANSY